MTSALQIEQPGAVRIQLVFKSRDDSARSQCGDRPWRQIFMKRRGDVWIGDCVSDAEAGNAIELGEGAKDDEVWKAVDIGHKRVLRKIVDEGFVKEDVDVSLCGSYDEAEESFAAA